jgi:hypothetical protein
MTRADRQRRRTAVALAASALAHVTIFGLLALYTPAFHPLLLAARDFQIELVPTIPLAAPLGQAKREGAAAQTAPAVTPRNAKHAPRHTDVQTTTPYPLPTRPAAPQTPNPPQPPAKPPPPTAHAPTLAGPLGPTAGAATGPAGGVQGAPNGSEGESDTEGARVRGALRTSVGCDDPDFYNLSKAERAVCHRQFGVQAAIGARQYVDPISSAKVRNQYDRAREACERLNHYDTPLDSDSEHSAHAPGKWGLDKLKC